MRVKITAGTNVYLIAGESQAQSDGNYQGRLLNEINLNRALNAIGTTPVTLDLSIRNDDAYILRSVDLWAAAVEVAADGGQTWSGKITAYDNDAEGVLRAVATERAAPELEIQFPDEVARLVTVDENFHTSAVSVTLPLVIGGTVADPQLIKGILIDKTAGIYLLCVGEIHQVVKVYRGTEELSTGFTAYTGTAGQASYPGFAYVAIAEAQRLNDDGSYVEVSADVVGLKLGASTIEECRNGARFLQYLLTTAASGVNGWGLGIAEADIDTDSFTTAISRLDTAGLKLDGVFYFRQVAQSWIDQICQAIRGGYSIGDDGKRKVFVNASASSTKAYAASNMRVMRDGKGAYTGRVYNKGKLDYDYNPITGQFMQSAQYENATSIAAIGEQEFYGQSYLIKDAATAQAILEYNCKKSLIGAEKVLFETIELAENARVGDIITITHPAKSLTGDWQITSLEIGDYLHNIEAEKFSADIFAVGSPGTAIDWVTDQPIIPSVTPGAASGLTLSSEIRPGADGTNIVVLSGTFTQPASAYLAASIEYGEGALPILDWKSLGMVQGNSFEVVPVKPAQLYAVRIRMISSTGKSDYVTATITTQGDAVPPGQPSISATSYLKNISAIIALGTVPSDLAGFQIFRHTANNSAAATLITSVSSKDGRAEYHEVYQGNYGDTLYYWAKAFDTWGNVGAFSSAAGPLTIAAIEGADIVNGALSRSTLFAAGVVDATAIGTAAVTEAKIAAAAVNTAQINNAALSMPAGPVAAWTAKGATTSSIAEANGVRDISGNSLHAQATGTAVYDSAGFGKTFSFDGVNDVISAGNPALLQITTSLTVAIWVYNLDTTTDGGGLFQKKSANSLLGMDYGIVRRLPNTVQFVISDGATSASRVAYATQDAWEHFVGVYNSSAETTAIYKNGVLVTSGSVAGITPKTNGTLTIGGGWYSDGAAPFFKGRLFAPRVYNRALTAAEIKTLYMMTEDATFGTITADLLTTGELITKTAQIKDAIISSAKISALDAAKITTGYLAAARIEGGTITGAKLAADTITTRELLIGKSGSALNPDPNFEDASAWTPSLGSYTHQTIADGVVGNKVIRSDIAVNTWPRPAKKIPVDPGKQYRATALVRAIYPTAPDTGLRFYIGGTYRYNAAGGSLDTLWGTQTSINQNQGWVRLSAIITPAAGVAFIQPAVGMNVGAIAGAYGEVQDFRLEECLPATLIQDGAIVTDKLAVGAVKAGNIYAGAVETAKLDVNAVTADKIAAGAITADKINVAALKAPAGAVGSWNAKGATTASIALAGGVKDVSGNGNHGQAFNGVAIVDSDVGKAFSFDGADDYIQLTQKNPTQEFTLGGWIKYSAGVVFRLFDSISISTNYGIYFGARMDIGSGAAIFAGSTNGTSFIPDVIGTSNVLDGNIHHIVVSISLPNFIRVYVDGVLEKEVTVSLPPSFFESSAPMRIGARVTGGDFSNGQIAHPKIYNRALTAAEIKTLYMLGSDSESGTITADRVVTGQIKSLNYSTTAGSLLDLDNGNFTVGGSISPVFTLNAAAKTGKIAGFSMTATDLTAGTGATAIGISTNTAKRAFWAGGTTPSTAKFNVSYSGNLYCVAGQISAFAVTSTSIQSLVNIVGGSESVTIYGAEETYPGFQVNHTDASYYTNVTIIPSSGSSTSNAPVSSTVNDVAYYGFYTNGKGYAHGGWVSTSDETVKSDIQDVSVLKPLKNIPVKKYRIDNNKLKAKNREREFEKSLREKNNVCFSNADVIVEEINEYNPVFNISAMAKEFNSAFGVNRNSVDSVCLNDQIGVALRAIQELAEIVDDQKAEIAELRAALNLPKKQKKQVSAEFTAEEIEKAADKHVKAAYDNIMQELKQ